ncbi:hypothetical protein DQQ10_27600 [Pseudochryseolinea flava]|uniref:Uncharacterized protein n=1 Tax=Pseudochryseolinea flava TaxID=2059302 RepID=A0A364XU09_9BACT|nr:hypothetical protein DQQ10_27600 [Pseudochryseolinea flava]
MVFLGIEKIVSRNTYQINNEIKQVLTNAQVNLKEKIIDGELTHEPTWLFSYCSGDSRLIKISSPLELFHIPCGYILQHDILKSDNSFILTKR